MLQHASPVVLESLGLPLNPRKLTRISTVILASTVKFPEKLLQELIHSDPGILPVEELDRAFVGLRPVCQELPLANGSKYVDNLLINPDGRICIVECKLWRNPEAVREVVAQVLDYAAELARLSYLELEAAAAKAVRQNERDFLVHRVLGDGATDGQRVDFIDGLSQSLRNGAFLLLIAGDGIRPGLQQIAEMLNRSSLGFSLGLVEMAFYGNGEAGPFYVQPRILLRTETATRTVFVLADKEGKLAIESVTEPTKPQTISEQEFFQKLAAVDPSYPREVRELIDEAKAVGCAPELRRTYLIYAEAIGVSVNLGHINNDGTVTIWGSAARDSQIGRPLGEEYMRKVASLLPSTDIKDSSPDRGSWYVRHRGRASIPLKEVLARKTDWISAIASFVEALQQVATSN
jgi:hypothetical protein